MKINTLNNRVRYSHFYHPKFDWNDDSNYKYKQFTDHFVELFADKINWYKFVWYNRNSLSKNIKMKYADKINWIYESLYHDLTEQDLKELLKKNIKLNWLTISRECKLSESFILKHKHLVNWHYISEEQKLSKKFIKKYHYVLFEDNDYYKKSIFKRISERFQNWFLIHKLQNIIFK